MVKLYIYIHVYQTLPDFYYYFNGYKFLVVCLLSPLLNCLVLRCLAEIFSLRFRQKLIFVQVTHVNYYEKPVPQRKRSVSGTKLIWLEVMREKSVIPKWVGRIFCLSITCINGFATIRGIYKWTENIISLLVLIIAAQLVYTWFYRYTCM